MSLESDVKILDDVVERFKLITDALGKSREVTRELIRIELRIIHRQEEDLKYHRETLEKLLENYQ